MSSKHESDLIKAIDEKAIFDQVMPAIRQAIKAGGGADAILKKSETIAAMGLIAATQSEKDEVRLKASTEILNRTIGRPVERSINIYGDISKMNERDIDNQILQLLEKSGGAKSLLKSTGIIPTAKKIQKRKPRKNEFIEATYTVKSVEGVESTAEAGASAESSDQSTPD